MASFTGTIEDFDCFIMPRIRNRVQTVSRPLKARANGRCEHCGEKRTLEAAHVHGRGRKAIVREVLEKHRAGDEYDIADLHEFEEEVMRAHEPMGECFLFLCSNCHRAYDSAELRKGGAGRAAAGSRHAATNGLRRAIHATGDGLADEFYDFLAEEGLHGQDQRREPGHMLLVQEGRCARLQMGGVRLERLARPDRRSDPGILRRRPERGARQAIKEHG